MKASGIVLAGGRGSRAGGVDKGLLPWRQSTRVEAVLLDLQPQVDDIIISANRNLGRYRELGFNVVEDQLPDFQGPLAGIAACLAQCRHSLVIVVPCDSPRLPRDLVARLLAPLEDEEVDLSFASDGVRGQYLFTAIRKKCRPSLLECLADGERSVRDWQRRLQCKVVDFSDQAGYFQNLNEAPSRK
jgi:molybdopterin-guanine dinucleotide biosynthesis protein A